MSDIDIKTISSICVVKGKGLTCLPRGQQCHFITHTLIFNAAIASLKVKHIVSAISVPSP